MLVDQDIGGIKEEEMTAMDGYGGDANHKYKGVHRSIERLDIKITYCSIM